MMLDDRLRVIHYSVWFFGLTQFAVNVVLAILLVAR
jgi:hypothetical protein